MARPGSFTDDTRSESDAWHPVAEDDAMREKMPKRKPPPISQHVRGTYHTLRTGIGLMALLLPVVLVGGGFLQGLETQDSISAYYHAFPPNQASGADLIAGHGVMRNWFVGILWTIGVFLFLYRGYGRRENVALNIAGLLLVVVAMVPMAWTCGGACPQVSIHAAAAALFFFAIGYVCIFRSGDTLLLVATKPARERYRYWYRLFGTAMVVLPVAVVALHELLPPLAKKLVIVIECLGIWTFAAYWLMKTKEIKESDADEKAMRGLLQRPQRKPGLIGYLLDDAPLVPSSESEDRNAPPNPEPDPRRGHALEQPPPRR
jgi:hypothetical protein